uniref:G domain-containing protein n=1 Tax=Panagrellus redivivus TaxID=6233 RepID=A0A7E4W9F3_PANRE
MTETSLTPVKRVPTPEDGRKTYNVVVISASASTWTALSDCVTLLKQETGARVTLTHGTDDLTSNYYIADFGKLYIRFIVLIIDPAKKALAKTDLEDVISKHAPNGYMFLFEINKDLPKIRQNVQKTALYQLLPDYAIQYTWSVNIFACESATEPTDIHFRGFCASKDAGNADNYFYIVRETLEAKKCQSAATVPTDVAEIGKLWKPTEDKLLQFVQMLQLKIIIKARLERLEKLPVVPKRNIRYGMENGPNGGVVADEAPERPVRTRVGITGDDQPVIDARNTPESPLTFPDPAKLENTVSENQPSVLTTPPPQVTTTQETHETIPSFTPPNLHEPETGQFQTLSTSPIYTILVIGSSEVDKAMLLNTLHCLRTSNFDTLLNTDITCPVPITIKDSEITVVKSPTPNRPDDYIIHFGKFKIWFVNTPTIQDEPYGNDAENNDDIILEYMIKLPKLHGIVFTINNNCNQLSANMENLMLAIYEILPSSALQNCCFMYTAAQENEFQPGRAASTLLALERKSLKTVLSIENQFCVDTTALEKVLVQQASGNGGSLEQFRLCWDETAKNLEKFLNYVDGIEPTCPSQWNLDEEVVDPVKSVNFITPVHVSKNWMLKSMRPLSEEPRESEFDDVSETGDRSDLEEPVHPDETDLLVKTVDSKSDDKPAINEPNLDPNLNKPSSNPEVAQTTLTKPLYEHVTNAYDCFQKVLNRQTYTVVVFGALKSGKSTLINTISCMQHHSKFEDAAKAVLEPLTSPNFPASNDEFVMVEPCDYESLDLMNAKSSTTHIDNEYVVDFDDYSVKFVEMPGINVKGGLEHHDTICHQIMTALYDLKEIHSFIFVIKDDDEKSLQNMLQSMFKLLPRSALSNCNFINFQKATFWQPVKRVGV